MVTRHTGNLRAVAAAAGLAACVLFAAPFGPAAAADMPDDSYLRGSLDVFGAPTVPWDGIVIGGTLSYSNLTTNFQSSVDDLTAYAISIPNVTANDMGYGGFLGYNFQVDPKLVLGFDVGYTRPSSLVATSDGSGTGATSTSSYKLVDWGTFRARAGYPFGQFLPYAFVGAAVGRIDYSTTVIAGSSIVRQVSRDNVFVAGFVAGLGIDVALMPNVFLRGEWEYIAFAPVDNIRSQVNTGRVGIGVRF